MKYYVKLSGNICHYQFADIKDIQVNDIEFGEMDYFELEEQFLLDNCDLENERMIIDDNIKFEVFNEDDKKILEFSYHDIEQNDEGSIYFSAEPQYNDEYQNCLGSLNFLKGENREALYDEYKEWLDVDDNNVINDGVLYCNYLG